MVHPSRRAYVQDAEDNVPPAPTGIALEDIPMDYEYNMGPDGTGTGNEKASAILAQMTRKRMANDIVVSTNEAQVKADLRAMGEPITLFGEGPYERRQRLKELKLREMEGAQAVESQDVDMSDDSSDFEEEFYTRGTDELRQARIALTKYSMRRTRKRIDRELAESSKTLPTHVSFRNEIKKKLAGFELQGSQAGDSHISMVRIAPNDEILALSNRNGQVKLYDLATLEQRMLLRGHTGIVSGLAWFPGATIESSGVSPDSVNLASCSIDTSIQLWSLTQDTPLATLKGHQGRVSKVDFHPSGRYLASASDDKTWQFWDVETQTSLQVQEGHSGAVTAVSWHADGSLVASGDSLGFGHIWDIRTGKTILSLPMHTDRIPTFDWSNSVKLLSGSSDNWIKCWDIRNFTGPSAMRSIGRHSNLVSDIRWYKGQLDPALGGDVPELMETATPLTAGTFFVSSSFDGTVKITSTEDWAPIQTLTGHTGQVTCCDVSRNGKWLVSGATDRTVKLWGRNDGAGI